MPFGFDEFIVKEPTIAFRVLIDRYNIELREAQKIIDKGRLICNNRTITAKNERIFGNMKVLRFLPKSKGLKPIFRTKDFMVYDKPSGVLVHPNKVLTPYSLLDEIRTFGGENANGVHRIDMETSGLVLASLNRDSEILLKGMFEKKLIKKSYLAWAKGKTKEEFIVDKPIKIRQNYDNSKHKVEISSAGKEAKTKFTRLLYNKDIDATLLKVEPLTGRTHQIRIHLFHMKHPILGDPLYGTSFEVAEAYLEERLSIEDRVKFTGAKRLMLHANTLEFKLKNQYFIKSQVNFVDVLLCN
jgi:23S rRNA pseudouridine1911/1915/1917 synthase